MQIVNTKTKNAVKIIERFRSKLSLESQLFAQKRSGAKKADTPLEIVEAIVEDVRARGDDALFSYINKLDGVKLSRRTVKVPQARLKTAHEKVDKDFLKAVKKAVKNIRAYQSAIKPPEEVFIEENGVKLGLRSLPIERVGVYVPGGSAVLCSSILMSAIPAQVAGVKDIVIATPPRKDGSVSDEVLAVCKEIGIMDVYTISGAQAIAALAFGMKSIPKVDKIVGPGNIYVTLAKKFVFGVVDIDMFAGPSEVLIITDGTFPAQYAASDLISQAEHFPGSAIALTTSQKYAEKIKKAIETILQDLPTREKARKYLDESGLIVVTKSLKESVDIANAIAPEHLELMVSDPEKLLAKIRNAGAVFLGGYTPTAVGDYVAGPSHTLPTGGTSRMFSGLSVYDFLKRSSVISYSKEALGRDALVIREFADKEGLAGHWKSVDIRLNDKNR